MMFNLEDTRNIKGYSALKEGAAKVFQTFLNNFLNNWGMEARETIEPISVKYAKDSRGTYLRFDYKIYNNKQWLHIKSSTTWY